MTSIAVFAAYRDYTHRPIVVTATDPRDAEAELHRLVSHLDAQVLSGPYFYTCDDEGGGTFTPCEWPSKLEAE